MEGAAQIMQCLSVATVGLPTRQELADLGNFLGGLLEEDLDDLRIEAGTDGRHGCRRRLGDRLRQRGPCFCRYGDSDFFHFRGGGDLLLVFLLLLGR
jgi:hypothetical protein